MSSGPIAPFVANLDQTKPLSQRNSSLGMTFGEDSTATTSSAVLTKKSLILDARSAMSEMPSLRN